MSNIVMKDIELHTEVRQSPKQTTSKPSMFAQKFQGQTKPFKIDFKKIEPQQQVVTLQPNVEILPQFDQLSGEFEYVLQQTRSTQMNIRQNAFFLLHQLFLQDESVKLKFYELPVFLKIEELPPKDTVLGNIFICLNENQLNYDQCVSLLADIVCGDEGFLNQQLLPFQTDFRNNQFIVVNKSVFLTNLVECGLLERIMPHFNNENTKLRGQLLLIIESVILQFNYLNFDSFPARVRIQPLQLFIKTEFLTVLKNILQGYLPESRAITRLVAQLQFVVEPDYYADQIEPVICLLMENFDSSRQLETLLIIADLLCFVRKQYFVDHKWWEPDFQQRVAVCRCDVEQDFLMQRVGQWLSKKELTGIVDIDENLLKLCYVAKGQLKNLDNIKVLDSRSNVYAQIYINDIMAVQPSDFQNIVSTINSTGVVQIAKPDVIILQSYLATQQNIYINSVFDANQFFSKLTKSNILFETHQIFDSQNIVDERLFQLVFLINESIAFDSLKSILHFILTYQSSSDVKTQQISILFELLAKFSSESVDLSVFSKFIVAHFTEISLSMEVFCSQRVFKFIGSVIADAILVLAKEQPILEKDFIQLLKSLKDNRTIGEVLVALNGIYW